MTTWDHAIHAATEELARLAGSQERRGRTLSGLDVTVAATARAAVLAAAARVLGDVAPRTLHPTARGRRDLLDLADRDPLRALGVVLRDRGRPPHGSRSPSELLDAAAPGSPPTRGWAAAGRHALIADRIWTAQPRHLDGEHAWHVVRQVAALTELIAVLDPALTRTATAAGRPDIAAYVKRTAGLRLAAREAAAVAAAPPLGHARDIGHPSIRGRDPQRPITPVDASTAAAATRRLTALLRATDSIAPHQVRAVAAVGRDLAMLTAACGAAAPGSAGLPDALVALAARLNAVVTGRHGEAALVTCRAPALEHQLRDLAVYTRHAFAGRSPHPGPDDASRVAARLPGLVTGLAERVRVQVLDCRWVLPDRGAHSHLHYAVACTHDPSRTSRMLTVLDQAVAAVEPVAALTARPLLAHSPAGAVRSPGEVAGRAARPYETRRRAAHPAMTDLRWCPPSA